MAKHLTEAYLRRIAHIVGPSSAAAACLRDLEKLRSEGRVVFVLQEGSQMTVVVLDCDAVIDWLNDRRDNCRQLAATKTDQDGWLDDMAYFEAAIKFLEGRKREDEHG